MVIVSALVAALAVSAGAQDADLLLGKYTIQGKEVQARLPSTAGTIPATATHIAGPNGWKYLLDSSGHIVDKYKGDGGWSEVRVLYDEAKAVTDKVPWRIKVVIFSHSNQFEETPDGVIRLRRSQVSIRELDTLQQEIARFASMAEAYSGGNLQVILDVEQESDWMSGGPLLYGPLFALSYFTPFVNTGEYKVEDRVYRGPYNSVLYVHSDDKSTDGTDVSGVSLIWNAVEGGREPALSFSHVLLEAWERQVLAQARERGYRLGAGIPPREIALSFTPAMWRNVAGPLSEAGFLDRMRPPPGASTDSSRLIVDPVATLLSVDRSPLAALLTDMALDANKAMESGLASGAGAFTAGSGLLVKLWALDLFLGDLDPSYTLTPLRIVELSGETFVAFQVNGAAAGKKAIDLLKTRPAGGSPLSQLPTPFAGPGAIEVDLKGLKTTAGLQASTATDAERGEVLQVNEVTRVRQGRVYLHREPSFKAESHPYLEFWIKATNPEPLQITLHGADKSTTRAFLFGTLTGGSGKVVALPPAPGWQKVVLDLRQFGGVPSHVVAITLDVPRRAAHWERTQFGTVWIDDLAIRATIDGAVTPLADPQPKQANPTSVDADERALFASKAGPEGLEALLTLLKDRDPMVQVNAAKAFQRIKDPRAVPFLADLSHSVVMLVSSTAMDALAYQKTPEADIAIRRALNHYLDDIREKAASLLAASGDPKLAGPISLLYAARSWQTRRTAAMAIGQLPGDEAQAILLAFSNDKHPAVRLAFVRAANADREETGSRLLWIAVNDPSDHVRAVTAIKMIESSNEKLRAEGIKVLADDSSGTRIELLNHLASRAPEAARGAIAQNFKHSRADVRAAALRAYGALEAVTVEQLNDVLLDKMPVVQRQLLDVVQKKGLKLPPEAIESLRSSVDPEVVKRSREL